MVTLPITVGYDPHREIGQVTFDRGAVPTPDHVFAFGFEVLEAAVKVVGGEKQVHLKGWEPKTVALLHEDELARFGTRLDHPMLPSRAGWRERFGLPTGDYEVVAFENPETDANGKDDFAALRRSVMQGVVSRTDREILETETDVERFERSSPENARLLRLEELRLARSEALEEAAAFVSGMGLPSVARRMRDHFREDDCETCGATGWVPSGAAEGHTIPCPDCGDTPTRRSPSRLARYSPDIACASCGSHRHPIQHAPGEYTCCDCGKPFLEARP